MYKRQDEELNEDFIVPSSMDERVAGVVAKAVGSAAIESGVSELFNQPINSSVAI